MPPVNVQRVKVTSPSLGTHLRLEHHSPTSPYHPTAYHYRRVRYAEPLVTPPTANQPASDTPLSRFRRPTPLSHPLPRPGTESSPTDYTQRTPTCPQIGQLPSKSPEDPPVSEDCLFLEIYVPAPDDAATPPKPGTRTDKPPVFFFIHGGFLQYGSANFINAAELAHYTGAVMVVPQYRLHALGFLACNSYTPGCTAAAAPKPSESKLPTANVGFHDLRLALEWTAANIHAFGGDGSNITIGGLSAGAYAAFHQVMYETYLPDERALIKRVVMMSQGCGLQPKSVEEVQRHFDLLCEHLRIPKGWQHHKKFAWLSDNRSVEQIVEAVAKCPTNAFRAVTDGVFVRESFMDDIRSGHLADVMKRRGMKIMIGEVKDENTLYQEVSPPSDYDSLVQRLAIEFPERDARKISAIYAPTGLLPKEYQSWQDLFGRIYADCQVHMTARGLLASLRGRLPNQSILGYRIEYRLPSSDDLIPPEMGVTHASDLAIWSIGGGRPLPDAERALCEIWVDPLKDFLAGRANVVWGTHGADRLRMIDVHGNVLDAQDDKLIGPLSETWDRLHKRNSSQL